MSCARLQGWRSELVESCGVPGDRGPEPPPHRRTLGRTERCKESASGDQRTSGQTILRGHLPHRQNRKPRMASRSPFRWERYLSSRLSNHESWVLCGGEWLAGFGFEFSLGLQPVIQITTGSAATRSVDFVSASGNLGLGWLDHRGRPARRGINGLSLLLRSGHSVLGFLLPTVGLGTG